MVGILVLTVNVSGLKAFAEEKGLFGRMWDKVSSRWEKTEPASSASQSGVVENTKKEEKQNIQKPG